MILIENNYLHHNIFYKILSTVQNKKFTWEVDSWETINLQHFLVKETGKEISMFINEIIGDILFKQYEDAGKKDFKSSSKVLSPIKSVKYFSDASSI